MEPFGTYRPRGRNGLIVTLVRLGFGRGGIKRLWSSLWNRQGADAPVDVTYQGLKLRLHPWTNSIESKILLSSKLREEDELKAIEPYVKGGGSFVDIGANAGYYSMMAAKMGARRVASVEPNGDLVEKFRANIAINDFDEIIEVFPVIMGDTEEVKRLYIASDLGNSSLIPSDDTENHIDVQQRRLDSVLAESGIDRISALKIDVEGYEDRVLMPFFETASPDQYPSMMVLEVSSREDWEADVLDWMLNNGYELISQTRGNAMLKRAEPAT